MDKKQYIRINKYLSETGFCSRRKADQLILEGKIFINNKQAELGTKITTADKIEVEGKIIKPNQNKTMFLNY